MPTATQWIQWTYQKQALDRRSLPGCKRLRGRAMICQPACTTLKLAIPGQWFRLPLDGPRSNFSLGSFEDFERSLETRPVRTRSGSLYPSRVSFCGGKYCTASEHSVEESKWNFMYRIYKYRGRDEENALQPSWRLLDGRKYGMRVQRVGRRWMVWGDLNVRRGWVLFFFFNWIIFKKILPPDMRL